MMSDPCPSNCGFGYLVFCIDIMLTFLLYFSENNKLKTDYTHSFYFGYLVFCIDIMLTFLLYFSENNKLKTIHIPFICFRIFKGF